MKFYYRISLSIYENFELNEPGLYEPGLNAPELNTLRLNTPEKYNIRLHYIGTFGHQKTPAKSKS